MSTDPSLSLTPKSSASQSIPPVLFSQANDPGQELPSMKEYFEHRWSTQTQLICGVIALIVTAAAYWLWVRWEGYTGYSVFVLFATTLVSIGVLVAQRSWQERRFPVLIFSVCATSIVIGCLRMVWQPNVGTAIFTTFQIAILVACLRREGLPLWSVPIRWMLSTLDGCVGWLTMPMLRIDLFDKRWVAWLVPLVVGAAFLVPFVSSHPTLSSEVFAWIQSQCEFAWNWISKCSISEFLICVLVATISLGMMVPSKHLLFQTVCGDQSIKIPVHESVYLLCRNTLIVVNVVFVVFLAYEWQSLWFRVFPEGFYYAGYAHQGAAWLTIALAMSTLILSTMFTPSIQSHPQIRLLHALALLWFVCNVLLAIAVYNRLMIYVHFNGLTRMRIIGFVGVTCVVAGFIFVVARVLHERGWKWLLHRQSWALAISVYALFLLPIDWIAHRWNVAHISKDHHAPSVQISVHPISDEGLIAVIPLLESEEPILRAGVAAMLANRYREWNDGQQLNDKSWKDFQGSRALLMIQLEKQGSVLEPFIKSPSLCDDSLDRFKKWAYQWY